jgi:hypothetical protein
MSKRAPIVRCRRSPQTLYNAKSDKPAPKKNKHTKPTISVLDLLVLQGD